jgi:hypothetical protein
MESRVTQNLAKTESCVTENSANTENRVTQDSVGRKPEEVRGAAPSKRTTLRWCQMGITKTKKCRLQKMSQRELAEKKEEKERTIGLTVYGPCPSRSKRCGKNG